MSTDSVAPKLLDFQLATTEETITSLSGLTAFYELALATGVVARIREWLPSPGSNHGIRPEDYVMSLVLMFCGGGRTLEDIRKIQDDTGLRRLCGLRRVPGADAIGKWLSVPWRVSDMKRVNEHLSRVVIRYSETSEFTLDVDATLIATEKQTARMSYEGYTAFAPLLGYLAEPGLCVACDFRNGSVPAGVGVEQMLRRVHKLVTGTGKRLGYFRSDSAGYQAKVINACAALGVKFTITADQDTAVKAAIRRVSRVGRWNRLFDEEGKPTDREYTTAVHCMDKTEAFTLVIQRWPNPRPDLFEGAYRYYVIATNDYGRETQELIRFHNGRGNAENYHKELKNGFGLDYVPCRTIRADAVYYELGILAHNLTVALKRLVLGGDWVTKTIATLRWLVVTIAGKVVRHGRELLLRVARHHHELLAAIKSRTWQVFLLG
jgi:hypothetical protein